MNPCVLEKRGEHFWCEGHQMFHYGHMAEIAISTSEKAQAYRRLWAGLSPDYMSEVESCGTCASEKEPLKPPGMIKKALNYMASLAEHVASGSELVSDDEKAHRRKKCDDCQLRIKSNDSCSLCGCPLHETEIGDKLAWKTSKCFGWERHGLAIGVYNMPRLAELHILLANDKCGAMPILLCDDTKPGTERQIQIAALAKKYPNVEYWGNPENYGHHRGDATAFWKAIQWGKSRSLDVVCKMSMRHLINTDNWLQAGAAGLLASKEATGGVNCIDNNTRLYIRSECVLLDVAKWFDSGAYQMLQGRNSYAPVVELHYNHIMCSKFGEMAWSDEKGTCKIGRRWIWPLLNERRNMRTEGILWHCANTAQEYHELADKYGVKLDDGFHTGGAEMRRGFAREYKIG